MEEIQRLMGYEAIAYAPVRYRVRAKDIESIPKGRLRAPASLFHTRNISPRLVCLDFLNL